jgi:erythritol transport system substrate-binding protein
MRVALLLACAGCHRDEHRKKLIVVIVPSQDNPYFKAEADAAAARALEIWLSRARRCA